jgi:hypothetical protein
MFAFKNLLFNMIIKITINIYIYIKSVQNSKSENNDLNSISLYLLP